MTKLFGAAQSSSPTEARLLRLCLPRSNNFGFYNLGRFRSIQQLALDLLIFQLPHTLSVHASTHTQALRIPL